MAKRIRMMATSADENRVLLAGRVYDLPDDIANQLLAPHPDDPKMKFAEAAPSVPRSKVTKIPLQPDPEDIGEVEEDVEEDDE